MILRNIKYIPRYLLTWVFGGNWEYGWNPGLHKRLVKYYKEDWNKAGYSFWSFYKPEIKSWINIT